MTGVSVARNDAPTRSDAGTGNKEFPDGLRRNTAGALQTVGPELRRPDGIGDIGLAGGDVHGRSAVEQLDRQHVHEEALKGCLTA
jgi:hypothetical protein